MLGRIQPVKTVGYVFAKNWKTILLFVVAMLSILGFAQENLISWFK